MDMEPEREIGVLVDESELTPTEFAAIQKLNKDLKEAAADLSCKEVHYFVKWYYQIQKYRKAVKEQSRSAEKGKEPNLMIQWALNADITLENNLKLALKTFAMSYKVGQWLNAIHGIGPVISAGILAGFDIRVAPTFGHWESFAGMNPNVKWEGPTAIREWMNGLGFGPRLSEPDMIRLLEEVDNHLGRRVTMDKFEDCRLKGKNSSFFSAHDVSKWLGKRPWKTPLKTLVVFHAGECFVRTRNSEKSYYGPLFFAKKEQLVRKNERGDFAAAAAHALATKDYSRDTDAKKTYLSGKLPPAHIHARARRWVTKIFLSNTHEVFYRDYYNTPIPNPYAFENSNGDHRHKIDPPNWTEAYDGKSLKELYGE